jgi:serine/threonine protein kinase
MEEPPLPPAQFAERFFRETKAMARLEHPHVVPIYAAGQEDRFFYIAMRYLKDGSLAEKLKDNQPLPLAVGLTWLRQAAWAAAVAHRRGIIHRDIKPSNILLDGGIAFLADFGLVSLEDMTSITVPGTILGTPLYMAPEQFGGQGASTPRRDVFSFGVLLYLVATGRHPFVPDDMDERMPLPEACHVIYDRIRSAQFVRAGELVKSIPPLLDKVIARCLRMDPAERYEDASALLADLNTVQREVGPADVGALGPDAEPAIFGAHEPAPALRNAATHNLMQRLATTVAADSQPGRTCGPYALADEIGHGMNGVVYRAFDSARNQSVAVKILRRDRGYTEATFPGALRKAAELDHPGMIKLLDFGIEDGAPYIVQELINGPSLAHVLQVEKAIPLGFALEVARQLADILAYAHSQGVTHLDLKPSDVLFREGAKPVMDGTFRLRTPQVAVGDFGLRALRRQALKGKGTVASVAPVTKVPASYYSYTSPEQVTRQSQQPDERADVYSVGAIFYEMLAGRPPYLGADAKTTVMLVSQGAMEPPSKFRPHIPATVEALCMRALDRDPAKRPATAAELAQLLASPTKGR